MWFSCGAASAVAARLAKKKYGNVEIVYCDTGGEHPDNRRFLHDVEKWLGQKVTILKNPKYENHFDVYRKTHFLLQQGGARCTVELKKHLRFEYQQPDYIQIFGYTLDEINRAKRFNEAFPEIITDHILIEEGLTKENCLGLIWKQGLKIPLMYDLGYDHNNCVGCVKGGAGYWNKIRKDFPEAFKTMAEIERELEFPILKYTYLDELEVDRGYYKDEGNISCDFVCELANQKIEEEKL